MEGRGLGAGVWGTGFGGRGLGAGVWEWGPEFGVEPGGHSGTEWLPTAKWLHGAEVVNAKI